MVMALYYETEFHGNDDNFHLVHFFASQKENLINKSWEYLQNILLDAPELKPLKDNFELIGIQLIPMFYACQIDDPSILAHMLEGGCLQDYEEYPICDPDVNAQIND